MTKDENSKEAEEEVLDAQAVAEIDGEEKVPKTSSMNEKEAQQKTPKTDSGFVKSLLLAFLMFGLIVTQDYWRAAFQPTLHAILGTPPSSDRWVSAEDLKSSEQNVLQDVGTLFENVKEIENQFDTVVSTMNEQSRNVDKQTQSFTETLAALQQQYTQQQGAINDLLTANASGGTPSDAERQLIDSFSSSIQQTQTQINALQKQLRKLNKIQQEQYDMQNLASALSLLRTTLENPDQLSIALTIFQQNLAATDRQTLAQPIATISAMQNRLPEGEWQDRAQSLLYAVSSQVDLTGYIEPSDQQIAETPVLAWFKRLLQQLGSLINIRKLDEAALDHPGDFSAAMAGLTNLNTEQATERDFLLSEAARLETAKHALNEITLFVLYKHAEEGS